ncbi:MAG: hypothetical protein HY303_15325 [Candidatus Wallbacteria bacterium]|nr:hypothetical protein [Candidatus Wallbacteria bacterium]
MLRQAAVAALLVWMALPSPAAAKISSAEKSVRLQNARAEYRKEVASSGLDSARAMELRGEIARVESLPTDDADASSVAASAPQTSVARLPDEHYIQSLVHPASYNNQSGYRNPCGPYALTSILNSFGEPADFQSVYDGVAPSHDVGSGAHEVKSYLISHGHKAVDRNHGSLDDVASAIDRGERVMMMINANPDAPTLYTTHWIAVKGYKVVGGKRYWQTVDSYFELGGEFAAGGKYPDGIPDDELARMWKKPVPTLLGTGAGYSNYYITVGNQAPSIVDRVRNIGYGLNDTTSTEVLMSGARDLTRGFDNTFGPGRDLGQRLGGFFQMTLGGGSKVLFNLPPLLMSATGHALRDAGAGMRSWGARQWEQGGVSGKVAGAGATVLGAITTGAGWVLNAAGTIGSAIAGVAGDVLKGAGQVVGGIVSGAGKILHSIF